MTHISRFNCIHKIIMVLLFTCVLQQMRRIKRSSWLLYFIHFNSAHTQPTLTKLACFRFRKYLIKDLRVSLFKQNQKQIHFKHSIYVFHGNILKTKSSGTHNIYNTEQHTDIVFNPEWTDMNVAVIFLIFLQ